MRPFKIDLVDLEPECRQVQIDGELDFAVAEEFQKRLDAAAVDDVDVLVCLERCNFIDSTGIAALVMARKLMTSKGRRLLVCSPSGQVRRILAVTGLDDKGLIFASTGAALAELTGEPAGSR